MGKHNLEGKRRLRAMTKEALEAAYKAAGGTNELAEQLGVSGPTVWVQLKEMGVTVKRRGRPKGKKSQKTAEKLRVRIEKIRRHIRQLHEAGERVTLEAIGKRMVSESKKEGITGGRVNQLLHNAYRGGLLPGISAEDAAKHGGVLEVVYRQEVPEEERMLSQRNHQPRVKLKELCGRLAQAGDMAAVERDFGYSKAGSDKLVAAAVKKWGLEVATEDRKKADEQRWLLAELGRRKGWVSEIHPDAIPISPAAKGIQLALIEACAVAGTKVTQTSLAEKLGVWKSVIARECAVLCKAMGIEVEKAQTGWGKGGNYEALKEHVSRVMSWKIPGITPQVIVAYAATRELRAKNAKRLRQQSRAKVKIEDVEVDEGAPQVGDGMGIMPDSYMC